MHRFLIAVLALLAGACSATAAEIEIKSTIESVVVYPDGAGRSKLTAALIDKKLGCAGTARNWNTVQKLKELACSP